MFSQKRRWIVILLVAASVTSGCRTTYYAMWDVVGQEKRDLLRREVKGLRSDQKKLVKPLQQVIRELHAADTSNLNSIERSYNRAATSYERIDRRAGWIQGHINAVRRIATDLFEEWEKEIELLADPGAQQRSREKLLKMMDCFNRLDEQMKIVEIRAPMIVESVRDHVLELKHGLNAQSVDLLPASLSKLETDVGDLISDMERTNAETAKLIAQSR